jgi:formate hydrogenlyase subunit 3/multisubunit Na+/H+ antiporter MnhD subunit
MLKHFFPNIPLPFISLLLLLFGALTLLCLRIFDRFRYQKAMKSIKTVKGRRLFLKVSFLAILLLNLILTLTIFCKYRVTGYVSYTITDKGWIGVLARSMFGKAGTIIQVDSLGATAALIVAFIALVAGLRALADKNYIFTPSKSLFFMMTLLGVQGIFFSGGLLDLFIFMTLSQVGASGLYSAIPRARDRVRHFVWYCVSRVIILMTFLCGTISIFLKYKTYKLVTLSSMIEPGAAETLAFIMLVTPPLFLFIKSASYMEDASRRTLFAIRAYAAFFVVLRILFSLYGPTQGLEKAPWLMISLGCVALAASFCLSFRERDPIKFAGNVELCMKGFILVALGIGMTGVYGSHIAAEYGYGALESTVLLWVLFLPVSAILSIVSGALKGYEERVGRENMKGLRNGFAFSGLMLCAALCSAAGLPPMAGFMAMQMLYRSANFMNPLLTILLYAFSLALLFSGCRYIYPMMFGAKDVNDTAVKAHFGDRAVALPLALLFIFLAVTAATPGRLYGNIVLPTVTALMNGGQQSDSPERIEATQ